MDGAPGNSSSEPSSFMHPWRNTMAKHDYIESSGNVFADLGLADAEERLAKAELAQKIGGILRHRRLTQVRAADILGIDQPKVSALLCGQLARFSIEKLMQFLLLLGRDVSITIKPRQGSRSKLTLRGQRRGASGSIRGTLNVEEVVVGRASKRSSSQSGLG
jgi:predicted XRE-type DNA-binding protein